MSFDQSAASFVQWNDIPELRAPCMVVGFRGWSDAGSVSSDTVDHLRTTFEPRVFASISNEPFINYTLDRPIGQITDGLIDYMEVMVTEVGWAANPDGEHDLVVLLGKEPHYNWRLYAQIVLEVMRRVGVRRFYTIGGVQDTVSHTAPPQISIVATSEGAVADAVRLDNCVQAADYYGPLSVHTCLLKLCAESDIEGVSFWGHVPAYLQKNPRVVGKIVSILNRAIGMRCPVDQLRMKAVEIDRRISEILAKEPNLKRFVESVEQRKDGAPQGTGDKIIRLDDFVKRDPNKDPRTP
ncbi:MAG: PAC2 family protein [Desulfomonile sp.]|nr:PAC2 family protein [Desulfomonile sp.]